MILKIDGSNIKPPQPGGFNIERFNLTKSGRVASGLMTMDLIAKKIKLTLTYEVISGKDMRHILDLIDSDKMFFDVTYEEDDGLHTIICYTGAIPTTHFRSDMGWYYKNVTISLIQQ